MSEVKESISSSPETDVSRCIVNKSSMEFFTTPLPPLVYGERTSSVSTKSKYSGYPEVVLWDTFEEEVQCFQIEDKHITIQYVKESLVLRPKVTHEIEVKVAVSENVLKPLWEYLSKKEIDCSFKLCSTGGPDVVGAPDFVFYHNQIVKLVIEVKTIWSLTAGDNLAADYRLSGNTVRRPVQQIFGYMKFNNLKYGILTNYDRFYFMKRENNLFHISKSIKADNANLSVYRSLYYAINLLISEHRCSPNTSLTDDKGYDSDEDELEDDEDEEQHEDEEKHEDEEQHEDEEKHEDEEQYGDEKPDKFNDANTDYAPQYKKQKKQQNSKFRKIKFMNETLGYGQNGYVYKALCDDKICATKFCDTIKNKEMMIQIKNEKILYKHLKSLQGVYIPNKISSGYLKNLDCFYITCYDLCGKWKDFNQYTKEEKKMAIAALKELHKQNVLHNDVRSENFLIMNQDNRYHKVMLCDFGNSLILNSNNKKQLKKEENLLKKLLNYVE